MRRGLTKARFEEIFQNGKRVNGAFCRLMALPGTGIVGFATPKKLGSIAIRNRAKRRLSEAVRLVQEQVSASWDMIFSATMEADQATFEDLKSDAAKVLTKMRERWEKESESS